MRRSVPTLLALTVLTACGGIVPSDRSQPMRGLYVYHADAASFTDCASGKRYPVSFEAEHRTLERAYLAARSEPGSPIVVEIIGHLAARVGDPSLPPSEHLVVDQFQRPEPTADCNASADLGPPLRGTRWQVVAIAGRALTPGAHAPHFTLDTRELQVSGGSGCNRFAGPFELDG
ncbi:MAG: META domain-containing protein, partial [Thiotrichales bacterium]